MPRHSAPDIATVQRADRAPRLLFMLDGDGNADGTAWAAGSTAELMQGDALRLTARPDCLLYAVTLPFFEAVSLAE